VIRWPSWSDCVPSPLVSFLCKVFINIGLALYFSGKILIIKGLICKVLFLKALIAKSPASRRAFFGLFPV
jgi:hypothetical protein